MRVSTLVIAIGAAAGIGFGAHTVGHAVDGPARQLDTIASEPSRAANVTAEANISAAVSAAASYRFDHGTYGGMTTNELRSYDRGLASSVSVRKATEGGYCVESVVAETVISVTGPDGPFVGRRC